MKHIGDKIVTIIISIFGVHFGKIVGIFFISMFPIIELRGSIPVGYAIGLPWHVTMLISIIGNMLPVWFILFFIVRIFDFMKKRNILAKLVEKIEKRALNRSENVANREFLGLLIFVAIPFPGTGAWTGALIASLLKMDIKKSFITILFGVILASILVTFGVYGLFDKIILMI